MVGVIGLIAFLTVLSLSMLITRLATVALMLTGLSEESARFQARSTFTGTGFTTSEAENVVDHPVRRRIIMMLMLLRSAGIITIILSLILSFIGTEDVTKLYRLLYLIIGVLVLWLISSSRMFDRWFKHLVERALRRWTNLDVRDYASLLHLSDDYVIHELRIEEDDWLQDKKLAQCHLREEGVSVIGILRSNGNYVGVPKGSTKIHAGDTLILYGRSEGLKKLDERKSGTMGDKEHQDAVSDQDRRMQQQEREEQEFEEKRAHTE